MTTYAQLITDALDVIKDSGVDDSKVKDFIRRAESKLERDVLSDVYGGGVPRQMLARATGTTETDSTYTLPTDYLKPRSVAVGGVKAKQAPPSLVASQASGYAEADVTLDYYQKLPVLSDIAQTNWLIVDGFDVYLWATCLQYVPWGHEDEVFRLWNGFYADALRSLKSAHSPRPRGGFKVSKNDVYGATYAVIGEQLLFA